MPLRFFKGKRENSARCRSASAIVCFLSLAHPLQLAIAIFPWTIEVQRYHNEMKIVVKFTDFPNRVQRFSVSSECGGKDDPDQNDLFNTER